LIVLMLNVCPGTYYLSAYQSLVCINIKGSLVKKANSDLVDLGWWLRLCIVSKCLWSSHWEAEYQTLILVYEKQCVVVSKSINIRVRLINSMLCYSLVVPVWTGDFLSLSAPVGKAGIITYAHFIHFLG
jgi:hypothetical protein